MQVQQDMTKEVEKFILFFGFFILENLTVDLIEKKKRKRNVNIVKCFKGQVIIIIIIFNHSCKVVQWKLLLFIYLSIQFNIIYYNIGIWKYNKLCYVASIVVKIEKILKIHRVLIFNILYLRQQIFNISLNISLIFPLNLV